MNEENLVQNEVTQEVNENQQYIDAIRDLKANSVSKERYNKLVEENKNLLNSLVNGEQIAAAIPEAPKRSSLDIAKEMKDKKSMNFDIEFMEKALEFRERVLEETGEDCFVSKGHNVKPTQESYIKAQRDADIYRECLEYANGDNKVFINEVQRRMGESPIANIRNNRR